jgi:two-component system response regulator FixJ
MVNTTTRTIAVVDDDTAVLESYQFMLELAGFRVATFTSGLAYLEALPDVHRCMILDHHMPRMTGLELAERLRQQERGIPIILVTGAATYAICARAAELGIAKVLEKPPDERELLQFVMANH